MRARPGRAEWRQGLGVWPGEERRKGGGRRRRSTAAAVFVAVWRRKHLCRVAELDPESALPGKQHGCPWLAVATRPAELDREVEVDRSGALFFFFFFFFFFSVFFFFFFFFSVFFFSVDEHQPDKGAVADDDSSSSSSRLSFSSSSAYTRSSLCGQPGREQLRELSGARRRERGEDGVRGLFSLSFAVATAACSATCAAASSFAAAPPLDSTPVRPQDHQRRRVP